MEKIDNKGGAWKGVFYKDKLIGQMLAIIENEKVILKLTMLKQEYRNFGIMKLLSISMIDEIKNYREKDFRSIFAFIDSNNYSIIGILNTFRFKEVGSIPIYGKKKQILIFCKVIFDNEITVISPHSCLAEKIKKSVEKLALKRVVIPRTLESVIDFNASNINITIKRNNKKNPTKIRLIYDKIAFAEFLENKQQNSWYEFNFIGYVSEKIKYFIVKKIISLFNINTKIQSFTLITDINDVYLQELILELGFDFLGYMPFYGKNDGILFGISKINKLESKN